MVVPKRQEEISLLKAMLTDIQMSHEALFSKHAAKCTALVAVRRYESEGIGFLTKTLPKLGKAFDKALAGAAPLDARKLHFAVLPNSQLPIFMGELFQVVLGSNGVLLPEARAEHVSALRHLLYLFYKYEVPNAPEQEQAVLDRFTKTEEELLALQPLFADLSASLVANQQQRIGKDPIPVNVVRRARILLQRVFSGFDFTDIVPSHGPGSVATRQRLSEKFVWTNVSKRITDVYPFDAYFMASLGAVCDAYPYFSRVTDKDLPARGILVPKDSRGPRFISCEPVDFQWVQQGIMRSLVRHVESLPLTRYNVHFTDQTPNQRGALLGSSTGRYATLDLNEASDRVSLDLVRLLFPEHVVPFLEAVRSVGTELPDGRKILLHKYAPMGSALCFPVLALTVWSLLTAAAPDRNTRSSILVYGDDVIVPTAYAANAIEQLESFGLKVNHDKSCISGLFRESCGMDAFKGSSVTPIKLKSVWSSRQSPETYTSWIAYANSMYDRGFFTVYDTIVNMLLRTYGVIPDDSMQIAAPSLREVPESMRPKRTRWNKRLQRREFFATVVKAIPDKEEASGWTMLLRYFTESAARHGATTAGQKELEKSRNTRPLTFEAERLVESQGSQIGAPFSVRVYTPRQASVLVCKWVGDKPEQSGP